MKNGGRRDEKILGVSEQEGRAIQRGERKRGRK